MKCETTITKELVAAVEYCGCKLPGAAACALAGVNHM